MAKAQDPDPDPEPDNGSGFLQPSTPALFKVIMMIYFYSSHRNYCSFQQKNCNKILSTLYCIAITTCDYANMLFN